MGQIYGIKQISKNKIVYVGQTKNTFQIRWTQHKQHAKTRKHALANALNKYGLNDFEPFLIEECPNENLNEREYFWINYYNTYIEKQGYNLTLGGDNLAEHQKKKIYQYSLDGEYLQEYESIYEASLIFGSGVFKAANGDLKQSANYQWRFEKFDKISKYKSHSKEIAQYDKNGNFIKIYPSARQAAIALGKVSLAANIGAVALGKRRSAGGYIWKFVY